MKIKQLQEYSLISFLTAYEAAFAQGFRMSTESGLAPVEIAGYYVATLVQPEDDDESPAYPQEGEPEDTAGSEDDDTTDDKPVVKRGRKPKA